MDANQLQQLITAITQQIAQQMQPQQAAQPTARTPYEGGPLNVADRTGSSLYRDAVQPFDPQYGGKPEEFYTLVANLKARAKTCKWNDATHGILTINGSDLLTDYGRITSQQVETARNTREAANDLRAKQNATMMYECLWNSLTSAFRTVLLDQGTDFHDDGPTLFHHLAKKTQQATFAQAISTRNNLATVHPKRFGYDIRALHSFITHGVGVMRAAADNANAVADHEVQYFLFAAYERIKAPIQWVQTIIFYKNQAANDSWTATDLMAKVEALQNDLDTKGQWKPSDVSPDELVVSMLAQTKSKGKGKDNKSNKDKDNASKSANKDKEVKAKPRPPFADSTGKEGDTKQWNGKPYYYCDFNHKNGHWVTHKPSECKAKKASSNASKPPVGDKSASLQIDRNKLKQAMAAVFGGAGIDIDVDGLLDTAIDSIEQK